jgi:hypothetical protein
MSKVIEQISIGEIKWLPRILQACILVANVMRDGITHQ